MAPPYTSLPAPPSPTLTNPDMILPYGEYGSTPSPRHPYRPLSPADSPNMQFSIGSAHSLGPMTPTTPIIYGNGTMLSDIGEVTESESVVGSGRRIPGPAERRMLRQRQNSPLRSSPTLGYDAVMKRTKKGTHQRKISMESASTVTSEGHTAEVFRDFDDGVSVDDSNFQGDDEESVADTHAAEVIASETRRLSRVDETIGRDEDGNSSAALSRRAEQILLNAKKRLNNMEGNLTRARSSLLSPTNSSSSIHSSSPLSRSTPSPPINNHRVNGIAPSTHRQINKNHESSGLSPGHSRVYSENSIVTDAPPSPNLIRSASAAARYGGRSKYSPDNAREERVSSALGKPSPPLQITLQSLDEDESTPEFDEGQSSDNQKIGGRTSPGTNPNGLTRSSSSLQMRDLQDQMEGLKGRLSVLRDRARSDMKRRSLQSLRTPSPFTAAEQWYAGAQGYGEGNLSADAVVAIPPWNQAPSELNAEEDTRDSKVEDQPEYATSDITSVYEDVSEGQVLTSRVDHVIVQEEEVDEEDGEENEELEKPSAVEEDQAEERYEEDVYTEELVNRNEVDDYESDSTMYHDTVDVPLSHEDREDAFDYEHFFLHSAMGTISQQRLERRDRSGSFSSEDSVETTRGPTTEANHDERTALGHLRADSSTSISTLATFATATEGLGSDEEEDEDHDNFAVQHVSAPRSQSPQRTAKRSTFGSLVKNGIPNDRQPTPDEPSRSNSVVHLRESSNGHNRQMSKPLLDARESTGTIRNFPLVNKPKGQQYLNGSGAKAGNEHDFATLTEDARKDDRFESSPVSMLAKEDQLLVEKVVASVGKCVLGLQESGHSSYEARLWRRRLDAARRILEGEEGAV